MDKYFLFSVLRQMRRPIIIILIYYTIAIIGLTLIPGLDNNNQPYKMGIFHSFYIIVYTSTTIGFGEIPYEWTDNQRLWILGCAVIGVVLWVYSMGRIISLSRNKIFKEKIEEYRFEKKVNEIKKPFYIIVGYGVTGKLIVNLLKKHNLDIVLIDSDPNVFSDNEILQQSFNIPFLSADGTNIEYLKAAGLHSEFCKGVIVMSGCETANVNIALSVKLLEPNKTTFVRAEKQQNISNLLSFKTDHIISSTQNFSQDVFMLIDKNEEYNLKRKLNNDVKVFEYTKKIPRGHWVICGYNDITKKIISYLIKNNIDFKLIEESHIENKIIQSQQIHGVGVSKANLKSADIENSTVIFAANDDDFKNLSTIITAKSINPDIYTITKQNKFYKKELFDKLDINLIFQPQYSIATKVHSLVSEPFLNVFYNQISEIDYNIIKRIEINLNQDDIQTWHFRINSEKSFYSSVKKGEIELKDIIPFGHKIKTLMLKNDDYTIIEPPINQIIKDGDVLLFSGNNESFYRQQLLMYNKNIYNEYKTRKDKGIYNG